jgi:hypothetical protein
MALLAWPPLVKWPSRGAMTHAAWTKNATKDLNRPAISRGVMDLNQKWSEHDWIHCFYGVLLRLLQAYFLREAESRTDDRMGSSAEPVISQVSCL